MEAYAVGADEENHLTTRNTDRSGVAVSTPYGQRLTHLCLTTGSQEV